MKGKKEKKTERAPSVLSQKATPETVIDQVNNYGTYNIQPTADSENPFPAVAQGLPAEKRPDGAKIKKDGGKV